VERLTDDRFLKDGFYQPKSKDEEKEIRSMGNDLTFEKLYKHCAEVEKENTELQKQVDELKENANGYLLTSLYKKQASDHKRALSVQRSHWEKKVQQAVKDTAKEIYDWLKEHLAPTPSGLCIFKTYLKERYGVEVE
jgi:hypothetical protein